MISSDQTLNDCSYRVEHRSQFRPAAIKLDFEDNRQGIQNTISNIIDIATDILVPKAFPTFAFGQIDIIFDSLDTISIVFPNNIFNSSPKRIVFPTQDANSKSKTPLESHFLGSHHSSTC